MAVLQMHQKLELTLYEYLVHGLDWTKVPKIFVIKFVFVQANFHVDESTQQVKFLYLFVMRYSESRSFGGYEKY